MFCAARTTGLCFQAVGWLFALGMAAIAENAAQPEAPGAATTPQTINQTRSAAMAGGSSGGAAERRRHAPTRKKKLLHVARSAADVRPAGSPSRTKPEETNTWLIFGFTEGSDVGDKPGEWTISQDSIVRTGRTSAFAAWDGSTGFGYAPTARAVVSFAALTSAERNAGELERGLGVLASLKYQFLRRDESPLGVAVQISPYVQRYQSSAIGHDALATEFRLILDRALVSERWFAALNLVYLPQHNAYTDRSVEREATVEVSGAVSHRLSGDLFVGGEIRYLSKFHSYAVGHLAGHAFYLGPTLFVGVGNNGYFGAAWSVQVAGHSNINTTPRWDLENFERYQFRLKGGISF